MVRIGKYEFASKEQAEQVIEEAFVEIKGSSLNEQVVIDDEGIEQIEIVERTIYDFSHAIHHIGHYTTEKDEEGNPTAFSDKWAVDILFSFSSEEVAEQPEALIPFAVELEDEGIHGFAGLNYQSLKF